MSDGFKNLALVPYGTYKIKHPWYKLGVVRGFLTVYGEDDGSKTILYTSHENHHYALHSFKSQDITITPNGDIDIYFVTILSPHIKWGHGIGNDKDKQKAIAFATFCQNILCTEGAYTRA